MSRKYVVVDDDSDVDYGADGDCGDDDKKTLITVTFCSRRDQSTVQVTYWAGMVFDQLLGKRRNENGYKWEKGRKGGKIE